MILQLTEEGAGGGGLWQVVIPESAEGKHFGGFGDTSCVPPVPGQSLSWEFFSLTKLTEKHGGTVTGDQRWIGGNVGKQIPFNAASVC